MSSACANVLSQKDAMRKVMDILGEGHHLFVAGASKRWRSLYIASYPALTTSLRSVVGSVECVEWVIRGVEDGNLMHPRTMAAAAQLGTVSICQALEPSWPPFRTEDVCQGAARNAQNGLSILKWLRSDDRPTKWRGVFQRLCSTGGAHAKRPCPWNETACAEAAWRGDVEMLTWLLSDDANAPFDHNVWGGAARKGCINVLEMLLAHPKVRAVLEAAAEYEGGEATEHDGGNRWKYGAYCAASGGKVEVLSWLYAHAQDLCHWDRWVCCNAVCAKSLATLKWLRSESVMCAWDERSCPEQVLRKGLKCIERDARFEDIKQWVHANGHPCDCED